MKRLIFIAFSFLLLAQYSCKKIKPEIPEPKNPCDFYNEVSANFNIKELSSPPNDIWTETDTVFHSYTVGFNAIETAAAYKWYIGSETFTQSKASRFFGEELANSNIPITLVVKKNPNLFCFPTDDGYDSIVKVFHVSKYPIDHGDNADIEYGPIEGTYRVKNKDGLGDSIDITINIRRYEGRRIVDVINFDGFQSTCNQDDIARTVKYVGYRILEFERLGVGTYCKGISGKIENRFNNSALLEFHSAYKDGGNPIVYKDWYYEGRKL